MGSKYLPTIKDQKANLRYRQNQARKPPVAKPADSQPTPKGKQK